MSKIQNSVIYRLIVDGKYYDYYTSLKRANLAAREFIAKNQTIQIVEDKLN
jgi:hypothetical protein